MNIIRRIGRTRTVRLLVVLIALWALVYAAVLAFDPASRKGPFGFGPPAAMTVFESKAGKFSMLYPANWSAFDTPGGSHGDADVAAEIVVAGKFAATVTVARQRFQDGNLHDVAAWGETRTSHLDGYTELTSESLLIGAIPALAKDYEWTSDVSLQIRGRCRDVLVFANDIGYALSFCSSATDWPSLEPYYARMADSFQVGGGTIVPASMEQTRNLLNIFWLLLVTSLFVIASVLEVRKAKSILQEKGRQRWSKVLWTFVLVANMMFVLALVAAVSYFLMGLLAR